MDFRFDRGWQWSSPMWWIASTVQGYGYITVFQAVRGRTRRRPAVTS